MKTNTIHTGNAFDVLPELPDESVNCVMTSPPYWNLRDYGEEDQLGLEETPEEFVKNLADVFDEVERVLRPDGSLWLNLGDTYKDKDLQQIPARVALELQNRGWILRNRVTWAKPNPMPQSVKDRLNDTTEAIFHFVKNKDYYYDLDAIREEYSEVSKNQINSNYSRNENEKWSNSPGNHEEGGIHTPGKKLSDNYHKEGKNPGDVFEVAISGLSDVHFAVYPPELCEKPIKATCPKDGIVLDPFAGAGTTLLKAKELGRDYVGIELNPEYADMARARIGLTPNDPSRIRDDDGQAGFEAYTD
ncbi:DNA methyltransferase [Halorubrum tailed virus 29]|uniref:site-specific DNA-methyltransferase (cytosine-N(4)-specific) n=1 Tax=Halorubrum tailed virus 29 TaxID=2878010 RepID=A0AAE8XZH0_9CAUD|nr:DNA methyltransferase [Halorubrum tailed virus 29]UBF23326.1 N4-cytosine methyltransferase [Halorubrum tailed virus 29]